MYNYKTKLSNGNYRILLNKVEECVKKEKNDRLYKDVVNYLIKDCPQKIQSEIYKFIYSVYPIKIAEYVFNTERCPGLNLKFYRPITRKIDNKATIKFLQSGKINFDGGSSVQEIEELYIWVEWFFNKYKKELIYDISTFDHTGGHIESGSETSIYSE